MGETGETGGSTTSTRPRTLAHAYALALQVPADAEPAPTGPAPPRPRHAAADPNPDPWAAIDVADLPWLDDDPGDSRSGRARRRRAAVALSGALASLGLGTVALTALDGDRPQRQPVSANPTTTRPSEGRFERLGEPSTTASTTVDPVAATGTEVVEEPTEVEGITRTTVRPGPPTTTPTTRRPQTTTRVTTTTVPTTTVPATTTTSATTTPPTTPTTATTTTAVPETTTTTEGDGSSEP